MACIFCGRTDKEPTEDCPWGCANVDPYPEELACHWMSEDCGCIFCTATMKQVGDIWHRLTAEEKDAFHRTAVPGRRKQR